MSPDFELNTPITVTDQIRLDYLALLAVSGLDSADFLQGQLSCDIHALRHNAATVASFCNPKGRVISTLLVYKTAAAFYLIMPQSLQETVLQKLNRYVLRAKVVIGKPDPRLEIFGSEGLPADHADGFTLKMPGDTHRYIQILPADQRPAAENDCSGWRYQDIVTGFPWFELSQTELYIPQMLGIDRLGGISFSKGCYTGQEIIARTHYLGKAKRSLYSASCPGTPVLPGTSVLDKLSLQKSGSILNATEFAGQTGLLLVLTLPESAPETPQLVLDNAEHTPVTLAATL